VARQWFAVQVQPRKESLACLHLARQDFVHFAPRVSRTRRCAGRTLTLSEPLFPGYVFAALDLAQEPWRSINGTIGVARLVAFGDQPVPLPAGFVEALVGRSDSEGVVGFEAPLAPGDAVRIVGGALDDMVGTLVSADRHTRVMVLVELLSGPRRVQLPRTRLIAA
jgi:transcriptional antiterminator RfaH